tara:strand:+ start:141 stop:2117 length:1977 start_codon:yes stop_codon:yes gene_type:complete
MASPLQSASIAAPGFFGLNTQESGITLESGFALEATNCVIDKFGRLGARKGWQYLTQVVHGVAQSGLALATDSLSSVASVAHGLTTGDTIFVSGGTSPEYNGTFTVTVSDANSFTYTMTGTPSNSSASITYKKVSSATNLQGSHRFIDIDGTEEIIVWSTDKFYSYTNNILQEYSYAGSQTFTEGNWQAVTLNDAVYFFQRGYEPLYHDTVTNNIKDISQAATTATVTITSSQQTATVTHSSHGLTTGTSVTFAGANESDYNGTFSITVVDIDTYTYTLHNSASSPATGTITATWSHGTAPQGNAALAAYGRLWVADTTNLKTKLYWSNLLDGTDFLNGTAGELDISGILVYGNDEIVGLGAHNGFLIVFCKKNVIIFGDTDNNHQFLNPINLQLVEVISGVGCIARDSIQNTGTDILFLSESGLRSLGRVIQEKSTPMRDLSKNIRDDLVQILDAETASKIKSVYSEHDAFYLLTFPTYGKVYCFDTRSVLEDGSARATIWNNMNFTNWMAFEDKIYMTHVSGLAQYSGYQDNNSAYRMIYFTNYFDLGNPSQTKILKRLAFSLVGATGQNFIVKSGFDYSDLYNNSPLNISQGTVSEYNNSEYNIAEYSGGTLVETVRVPGVGSGSVIQLGFEADLNGGALSIQKIDIYVKQGRVL